MIMFPGLRMSAFKLFLNKFHYMIEAHIVGSVPASQPSRQHTVPKKWSGGIPLLQANQLQKRNYSRTIPGWLAMFYLSPLDRKTQFKMAATCTKYYAKNGISSPITLKIVNAIYGFVCLEGQGIWLKKIKHIWNFSYLLCVCWDCNDDSSVSNSLKKVFLCLLRLHIIYKLFQRVMWQEYNSRIAFDYFSMVYIHPISLERKIWLFICTIYYAENIFHFSFHSIT